MKVENTDDTKTIDTRSAVQAYLGQQTNPAQSAHQAYATSVGTNPDYEVELRRVAAQTGVPVDSARAYPDEVKRKAQLESVDFQAMQTKYPTTVNFMADRNNAQVAHDDLDGLQGVEDTLKPADRTFLGGVWQPIASGWNATVAGFGLTMGDALVPSGLEAQRKLAAEQGGVDYTPGIERAVKQAQLERTAQKYSAPADIQQGMQEIGGAQTFGYALEAALSNPRATLETALQSLGASAPALLMAGGGATLGPAGTATGAGLGSFSIEYASTVRDVMTASGINMTDPVQLAGGLNNSELMSQAREKAIKRGIPIAVFDALTAGMAGRLLAGAKPAVLSGVARGAGELGIQAGGGAAGEATAQAATGEYKPGDILMEALAELPSALVEVPINYRTLAAKAQAAEVQAARIEQITKTAQASKLAQRDADTFEKFVAAAKEEGPVQDVYIDAQALMQSGVAEQVAAASPAVADQLPTAAATGGVIRIPVEEYAARIAPTELSQSLLDHLRTEPEGFSRAEAQQFMQTQQEQLQNEMEKAVKAQEGDAVFKTERDAIAAQVRDQLDTVGRFSPEVHSAYATMIGNFFAVQGAKLGVSPQELFNRTGFSVAGSMADGPQLEAAGAPQPAQSGLSNTGETRADGEIAEVTAGGLSLIHGSPSPDLTADRIEIIREGQKQAKKGRKLGGFYTLDPSEIEQANTYAKMSDGKPTIYDVRIKPGTKTLMKSGDITRLSEGYINQLLGEGYGLVVGKDPRGQTEYVVIDKDAIDGVAIRQPAKALEQKARGGSSQQAETLRAVTKGLKDSGVSIAATERDGTINLAKIVVPEAERGTGKGTAAMQALLDYADRTGQRIELTPSADFGGNKKRLIDFYKRLGFVENKGAAKDFTISEAMYRPAQQVKTLQQADLESEAFKNWFGDSKVVDAGGKPLVVYHGTLSDFSEFKNANGIFFTTPSPDFAQKFLQESSGNIAEGANVMPVYVSAKNPFDYENKKHVAALEVNAGLARNAVNEVKKGKWQRLEDRTVLETIKRLGFDGVYVNEEGVKNLAVFDPSQIKSAIGNRGAFDPSDPNILEQKARGMFNPETNVITLLKNADLSTFLHESGHFFLEQQFALTNQLGPDMPAAQQELAKDTQALLDWFGVQDLDTWYAMDFEEQRGYHEKFAQGFEKYLFEGKAPSIELQPLFQRFAAWLKSIYRDLTRLKVELTPEVRGVLDRMLATNEQITLAEQARSMMPLFETPEKAGMTPEEFAAYQAQDVEASADAIQDMQARGLRDMQYISNARGREIKRLQKEAQAARTEVRMEVAKQVMAEPVYQAWQFLTGKISAEDKARLAPPPKEKAKEGVDPSRDSLFTAIAKLGGINKDALVADGWVDPVDNPKSGVFGKPVVRKNGGKTLDGMLEALGEQGYVPVDKHGKGDLADLEAAFSAELSGDPQYSVWYNYADGLEMLPGEGANVYELTNGRLDLGSLRLDFSIEVVDKLVARRMTAVNGIHHDLIAEKFGFASGDELTRALAETSSPSEEIEGITDRVMLERYGELATPEAIEKAADKAIHNTVRGRMLATEANALARMTGQRKVLMSAAKELAGKLVGRLKIVDLRPQLYVTAEGKAGRAADTAFRKGDTQQAAAEKRNQLVNHELARTAYDAQDEVIKIDRFFKRIVTTPDDKLKRRDMDVVNAARAVLSSFGYGAKAKNAAEYLSKVQEYDPAMYEVLAASVVAAQEIAQGDVKQLTVDQLRALNDEVSSLWYLSKRVRQMEIDGDLMDREDVAEQLQARMAEVGLPSSMPGEVSAVTPDEERSMRIASVKAVMRRVESWVDMMDGSNKLGVFRRYLWTPIKEAADQYRADRVSYLRQFRDTFSDIAQTMKRGQIVAPELNYTFGKDSAGVAMNEILHAILHTGNASNKRKLLLGRGWAQEQPDGTLDTSRWDAFINRMVAEGKLVKEHFDFAQRVWDLLEQTKPLAQKAHRAAYGKYFDEVTAEAFTDPFGGVRRGGYVPAQVDSRIVKDNELKKLIEEGKEGMAYAFPGTSKGFTKSRTEYNRPLLLDLRTLPQHIDKVLLFSHMELPSRDAAKLLYTKGLSSSLNKFDPAAITGMLMPWLNRSARQQVTTPIAGAGWMMRMLNTLRNRTSMATMFANLSNTAQQITGFSLAALKVRPSSLAASTAAYLRAPKRTAEEVAELSVFMRNRMSNEVAAMMGEIQGILLDPNAFEKAQEWAMHHTYFMQSAFDNVMGPIIWRAAYSEALEQNFDTKDAVRIADATIRQTQGSTLPEDVSRIETGPAYARLFTQFVGYFNMQANLLGTEFAKMSQEMGVRKGMGRGLYITLLGFYIPAMVAELVAQSFRGGPGDDDKDGDYLDDWLMATLVYGPMRNATAFVPFAGQVINSAVARFNGNPNDDKMSMSPAVSSIEAAVGVPFDLYKIAIGEGNAQRTVKDVATLISLTTGIPASVAARPISYLAGIEQRTIQPTSAPDLVRGLATGAASPESKGR
jgi:GNAT superfamily N-acetyltransferase